MKTNEEKKSSLTIKELAGLNELALAVLAWLGQYRSRIDDIAVSRLQDIVQQYGLASKSAARQDTESQSEEQLVTERDEAEEAMSQAFYLITGRSPEWSNLFGYKEALQEIDDAQKLLRTVSRQDTEPTQMFLCEINNLFLHPNQLYVFQQAPDCQGCADYAQGKVAARCGLDEGEQKQMPTKEDIHKLRGIFKRTEPHKAEDASKQKEPLTNYVTEARIVVMRGIDRSPNLPSYVKPMAKAVTTAMFSALGQSIGGFELTVYRTLRKQAAPSVQERSESDSVRTERN